MKLQPIMKCWLHMNDTDLSEVLWCKLLSFSYPTLRSYLDVKTKVALLKFCPSRIIFFLSADDLTAMVKEWPHRQAQTKAAVRKERPLREKVISDVRKRVSQIRETLKPALENSSVSRNATEELNQMANNVAKVCVFFWFFIKYEQNGL